MQPPCKQTDRKHAADSLTRRGTNTEAYVTLTINYNQIVILHSLLIVRNDNLN